MNICQTAPLIRQRERHDAGVHRHRNILPAIDRIGHRRGMPARIQGKMPQPLAGLCVQRAERAVVIAEKQQPAGGGQHAAPGFAGAGLLIFPDDLSGLRIDGAQIFARRFGRHRPRRTAVEGLSLLPPLLVLAEDIALLQRHQIEKPGAGMIGAWTSSWMRLPSTGRSAVPSAVGCQPSARTGRPSGPIFLAQVSFLTKGLAARNLPLVRSST